ncbi:LysR substrate-binding domain-containing protein [Paludibacterium yongneupense]|uniref:LysR substrate-binding domain-containing protein n=1 Tax=Paludibacterium yongneupense TaxID=400061 RepID=UPI0003F822EF|nr:LysR substrate-binding domain-containing protein [Paludibacterium yongneupense]
MELRHLRYFVAVADELHFGRAAEKLHIAQPALSIQIKALERQLGGALFQRSSRSVALTEAGQVFLREARATLVQAERALETAGRAMRGELGKLDIAYSGNAAFSGVLGRAVHAFRRGWPDVDIGLRELDPVSQVRQLLARRIQLGFTTSLCVDVPPELALMPLAAWPLRLALPGEHPLARTDVVSRADVLAETFIVYADSDGDDGGRIIRALVGPPARPLRRAASIMQLLALVAAGQGVALLPDSLQALASGTVFKPVEGLEQELDSVLMYWRDGREPVVDAFLRSMAAI